jgi:pimeloyl-ACP methyl ester carboxylesterase
MVPRLSLVALLALLEAGLSAAPLEVKLSAADGMQLKADHYRGDTPTARLVLVLPGFAQHKGTGNMSFVAGLLTPTSDVLVLDFRGTGASNGVFDFGGSEAADVQAALAWALPRYKEVDLLGFSLGAYSGLRAAVEGPLRPAKCLLVSLPENIDSIIGSGGVGTFLFKGWLHNDKLAQKEEGDIFFRWGTLLMPKPTAPLLAQKAAMPLHLLVGFRDQLVYPRLSRASFINAAGTVTWTQWADGRHAEHMALLDPPAFAAWVHDSLAWQGHGRADDPFDSQSRHHP